MNEVYISETECSDLLGRFDQLVSEVNELETKCSDQRDRIFDKLVPDFRNSLSPNIPRSQLNRLFEVFDKIKLQDGYTLDFIPLLDGGIKRLPHTRKVDEEPMPPILSILKSREAISAMDVLDMEKRLNLYLRNPFRGLEFEKSASGYFQFAVFFNKIHQIAPVHLVWCGAFGGPDLIKTVIFSHTQLDKLLDLLRSRKTIPEIDLEVGELNELVRHMEKSGEAGAEPPNRRDYQTRVDLNEIDLRPLVRIEGQEAEVVMVIFSHKWAGLSYEHSHIVWPNLMDWVERRTIVPRGLRYGTFK